MKCQVRRALHPTVEGMEPRQLLSGIVAALVGHPSVNISPITIAAAAGAGGGGGSGHSGGNAGGNGSGAPMPSQGNGILTPLMGQGAPTPREAARDAFVGVFQGPVYSGPGRFSDQASILYIRGVGQSNDFFHGNMNLGIATPTDPTRPQTGEAVLQDKNTNSGGVIGLILTPDPSSLDRLGRPTRATFQADPNIYGGIFFANTASGTVSIRYHGQTATVIFRGSVYTTGLTSPLKNADLVAREGSVLTG